MAIHAKYLIFLLKTTVKAKIKYTKYSTLILHEGKLNDRDAKESCHDWIKSRLGIISDRSFTPVKGALLNISPLELATSLPISNNIKTASITKWRGTKRNVLEIKKLDNLNSFFEK
jgi:hypothetical protein